jgi:hypothetical protein
LVTFYFKKALPIVFQVKQKENVDEQTEIRLNTVDGWKRRQTQLRSILVDLLQTRAEFHNVAIKVFFCVCYT